MDVTASLSAAPLVRSVASGFVAGTAASLVSRGKVNLVQVAADAFGKALAVVLLSQCN